MSRSANVYKRGCSALESARCAMRLATREMRGVSFRCGSRYTGFGSWQEERLMVRYFDKWQARVRCRTTMLGTDKM